MRGAIQRDVKFPTYTYMNQAAGQNNIQGLFAISWQQNGEGCKQKLPLHRRQHDSVDFGALLPLRQKYIKKEGKERRKEGAELDLDSAAEARKRKVILS